jgi:outer membrane protein
VKYIVLIFIFICTLFASEKYSLRVGYGEATSSDFGEVVLLDWKSSSITSNVIAVDGGYLLKDNVFDVPIDLYVKIGLNKFQDSNGHQGDIIYKSKDVYEGVVYIKAYWNIDFLKNRLRIGLGEGLSYTSSILNVEKYEADEENDNDSKFLNYIDFNIDFDFGRLMGYKPLYNTYIGWAIKHRSGIFGLINNVRHGGSNYNAIYIEKQF